MMRRLAGFTLQEMLTVVAIITILCALILPVLRRALERKAVVEASAMLDSMAMALVKLKDDYEFTDALGAGDAAFADTNEFAKELSPSLPAWGAPYTPRLNAKRITYMEFKQHQIRNGAAVDPWGQPYRYRVATERSNGADYRVESLYSAGPDQQANTDDDIVRVVQRSPIGDQPQRQQ